MSALDHEVPSFETPPPTSNNNVEEDSPPLSVSFPLPTTTATTSDAFVVVKETDDETPSKSSFTEEPTTEDDEVILEGSNGDVRPRPSLAPRNPQSARFSWNDPSSAFMASGSVLFPNTGMGNWPLTCILVNYISAGYILLASGTSLYSSRSLILPTRLRHCQSHFLVSPWLGRCVF